MFVTTAGLLILSASAVEGAPSKRPALEESAPDGPVSVQVDSCSPFVGCSQIHNDSNTTVLIRPDWNCGGSTGSTGGAACAGGSSKTLYVGDHTPTNEDWDTFRVDAGWCYKVRFYLPFTSWTSWYNRSGLDETWVKVENWATAVVVAQRAGSCPA
jgi:hypothetical protein